MELTSDSGHVAELARHTEAAGFDALFFPEHVATPVTYSTYYRWGNDGKLPEHYNRWPDPYVCVAVASAVTSRIRIGTGISLLPEHEPIALAKTIATLDFYAGGRTMFAFGAGWLREETALFGVDFKSRWQRWEESVAAMKTLWTYKEASYQGEIIKFPPVRCEPKPVQRGGPKVLVGVHRPDRAFPMVVNHADGWFPLFSEDDAGIESVSGTERFTQQVTRLRQMASDAGRNPDEIVVVPIMMPRSGDVPERTMAALQSVGVRTIVISSGQAHGTLNTASLTKEWIDKYRFLAERAHALG